LRECGRSAPERGGIAEVTPVGVRVCGKRRAAPVRLR
jgi:hypothetical protein